MGRTGCPCFPGPLRTTSRSPGHLSSRLRPRGGTPVSFARRLTASVTASALVMAAVAACESGSGPRARTAVGIGADLASGSATDAAYARALQLRVEQVNASGVLGEHNLVLRVQDNKSDPTASLRNISMLADDPAVAAI